MPRLLHNMHDAYKRDQRSRQCLVSLKQKGCTNYGKAGLEASFLETGADDFDKNFFCRLKTNSVCEITLAEEEQYLPCTAVPASPCFWLDAGNSRASVWCSCISKLLELGFVFILQ